MMMGRLFPSSPAPPFSPFPTFHSSFYEGAFREERAATILIFLDEIVKVRL